jgi:hypothetical protein
LSAYTSAVLADSPIGYWRLNETSGTTAVDYSSNANNGTYSGTYALGATSPITGDPSSKALDLTGTQETVNGYVTIPDSTPLNITGTAFTVECWIKSISPSGTSTSPYAGLYFKQASVYNYGINHDSNGMFPVLAASTTNYTGGQTTPTVANDDTATWIYLVGVYNGSVLQLYSNGSTLGSSATCTGNVETTTGYSACIGNILTGSAPYAYQWQGYVCEVAIYSTALSSTRISAHYAAATQTWTPSAAPFLLKNQAVMKAATR